MSAKADEFDLGGLRLSVGEGRRIELGVRIEPLVLADEPYAVEPEEVPVKLEISRMTGGGYALRLRFEAALSGICMRCLKRASPKVEVEAREVDTLKGAGRPGEGEELESPYMDGEKLDLAGWARDAFALAVPAKVLCREDCAGLCPICAADLNDLDPAGPEHHHESVPDPRWAKLRELQ
ncbi:MAG TPA: DUF177 domain-containing protein [Solirubrobacteraceae bacterium]|nr:DUF177 domain-containing protein [Solirubrobacteraceae bacterium]